MSRTHHHGKNHGRSKHRQIRVRAVRRDPIDMRRLARAPIALAQAEAEAAAQAEHQASAAKPTSDDGEPTQPNDGRAA